jgi:AraC family transcriptional regulator
MTTPLFRVCAHDLPVGYRMGSHCHAAASFVIGLSGAWIGELGRREHTCGPGEVVTLPHGARHREHGVGVGARCLLVTLVTAEPGGLEPATARFFGADRRYSPPAAARVGARLADELAAGEALAGLHVEGLLFELLAALAPAPRPAPDDRAWLRRLRDQLDAHFLDPVDVGAVAASNGRSREHAYRTFRRAFGASPGDYVRARRLERAARLLEDTDLSVATIAAACGFTDQSHLTRWFHARFGSPPARFRLARSGEAARPDASPRAGAPFDRPGGCVRRHEGSGR